MNYMDFNPDLIQECHQQMLRELNSLRLEKRLRDNRGSGGSRFFALAGAHCRCCAERDSPGDHQATGR